MVALIFPIDLKKGIRRTKARHEPNRLVSIVRTERKTDAQLTGKKTEEARRARPPVHTTPEQESPEPVREAEFTGARNTIASGANRPTDEKSRENLPNVNGRTDRNEINVISRERQDGSLENDGRVSSSRTRVQPRLGQQSGGGSLNRSGKGAPATPGTPDGMARSDDEGAENTRDSAAAALVERHDDAFGRDILTSIVRFGQTPSVPVPTIGMPDGTGKVFSPQDGTAGNNNRSPYDPSFTPDSQPGFLTHEKRTRTTGRFVFGKNPSLNVERTPTGAYQELIYRRISYFWYRECDAHRDMIIPGSLQIRMLINPKGQVMSMDLMQRNGASVSQQGFTFRAIRNAEIPPMPEEVRKDLVGDSMELLFSFYFDTE